MKPMCVICYEKYNSTSIIRTIDCGHAFHYNCINRYLRVRIRNGKCPECEKKIDSQSLWNLYLFSSTIPENNIKKSSDELKKLIKELENGNEELRKERNTLHDEVNDLNAMVYSINMDAKDVEVYEAENKKLVLENENLRNELKRLSNIKVMMEASSSDGDNLFKDIQTLPLSDKEKVAEIAIVCSISNREFSRSEEEKAHLQNELTKVKLRMEELENKYKNLPSRNAMDHICASSCKQFREAKKQKLVHRKFC